MANNKFIIVKKKSKYINLNKTNVNKIKLNQEEVINKVKNIMIKYKPYAVYLYGSIARNQNNENSDIDLFVIWKNKFPNDDIMDKINGELHNEFRCKIDFVNYVYNGKYIKINSSDSCFIQNVLEDAISIIEPKNNNYKVIKEILFIFENYFN